MKSLPLASMFLVMSVFTSSSIIANSFSISSRDSESEEFSLLSGPKHSVILRAPRSIGNFFRRIMGKGDKSSTSQLPASFAAFGDPGNQYGQQPSASASSYYPTYAPAMFIPQPSAMSAGYPPYPIPAYGPSMGSPAAAASSPYASYLPPGSSLSPNSPDFHTVLDSFVRSTGLAPQGSLPADQEAAASSFSQPGVTPAFSWKKLYSFPFYFSTDSGSGSRINIPYMKQHIRRMSGAEKADKIRDANIKSLHSLRQAQEQQKLLQALQSSELIATYLSQYLKKQEAANDNALQEKKSVIHRRRQPPAVVYTESARASPEPKPEPIDRVAEPSYQVQGPQQASSQPVPSYYLPQADQSVSYANDYSNPELYQRMSQLEELRRRRLQFADAGHQSASDQLHEQLRTRIVNDPRLLSESSQRDSSRSSSASLSDRLDQLQSLTQGLRSIPAPTSLSPTSSSYAPTYASDEGSSSETSRDEMSMSGQESQHRPTILTYYADPSLDLQSSASSSSSSTASASSSLSPSSSTSTSKSYSMDSHHSSKKQKEDPNTVSLTSSYSMSSAY